MDIPNWTVDREYFPASSVNAKEVVLYHHAFLAVNQETMTIESVADQLGWVGESAFLLRDVISAEPMRLQFSSNDAGESQILDSIGCEGTFEEWRESINLIKDYPKAMVAQTRYDELRHRFPDLTGAKAGIAGACAVISLAGELVHEALRLPWDHQDPVETLWPSIADEFTEIDIGIRAMRDVHEWACSNRNGFFGKEGGYPPAGGWLGQWDHDGPNRISLNIVPGVLKQQLERLGYTYREILNNWKEKGWLLLDPTGRNPRWWLAKQRIRMVSITRSAISEVTGEENLLLKEALPLSQARCTQIVPGWPGAGSTGFAKSLLQ